MSDNDNRTVYILVGVGITLLAVVTILSFLTYRKVDRDRQSYNVQQPMQELSNPTSPVVYDERIYNERIYKMLEDRDNKIHEHIEDVNSNINSLNNNLKSLNYRIPSMGIGMNSMNIMNNNVSKAGSVTSVKTPIEDKIRQKEFGMI